MDEESMIVHIETTFIKRSFKWYMKYKAATQMIEECPLHKLREIS